MDTESGQIRQSALINSLQQLCLFPSLSVWLSDCLSLSGIVGAFMAPHTPAIKQFAWQQLLLLLLLLQLRQQQCRLLAKLSSQASRQFGHSWSMESRQVASDKNVAIVHLLVVVASIVAAVAVSIVVAAVVACYCQRFVIMHIIVAAFVVAAALHAVVPAACWAIKEALPYSHTATEKVQQQQQWQQQPVTCNNNNNCYCNRQQHSQTSCRRRH